MITNNYRAGGLNYLHLFQILLESWRERGPITRKTHTGLTGVRIISPQLVCLLAENTRLQLHLFSSLLFDTEVEIINFKIFKTILLVAEVAEHQFIYFKRFMQLLSNKH